MGGRGELADRARSTTSGRTALRAIGTSLRQGLLDELHLVVHPIVVGDGLAWLFPPDEPSIRLELVSAHSFKTGVLNLSYAPANAGPT